MQKKTKKPYRPQAWRLKSKTIIIYTPGLKILNTCDKYTSVAPRWTQISGASKRSRKTRLSPPLASSSFCCPQVSALNFLKFPEKKPSSLRPLTSLQPRTTLGWERGRSRSHNGIPGRGSWSVMDGACRKATDDYRVWQQDVLYVWVTLTTLSKNKKKTEKVRVWQHHCRQIYPEALSHYIIKNTCQFKLSFCQNSQNSDSSVIRELLHEWW